MATEACGGGTFDLGYFLGVYVFIGIFGGGFTSGGVSESSTRQGALLGGLGAPSILVDGSGLFWPNSFTRGGGLLLVHKKPSKLARQLDSVWYSFYVKLKNEEKTETGTEL